MKKTAKTVKPVKKVAKVKEPSFIIDCAHDFDNIEAFMTSVAIAKTKKGLPITERELACIAINATDICMDALFGEGNNAVVIDDNEIHRLCMKKYTLEDDAKLIVDEKDIKVKKPNWFKRLLNKFRRK